MDRALHWESKHLGLLCHFPPLVSWSTLLSFLESPGGGLQSKYQTLLAGLSWGD